MKSRTHISQCLLAALLTMAGAGALSLCAAPPPQPAKVEIQPSVFSIPSSPPEGRDPFFPASTRVYASNIGNKVHGPVLTGLTLKSILGTPPDVFVIINNHTFASGDDGVVLTQSGERLHITCVDINQQAGTATIEDGGQREVLHLSQNP